MKNPIQLTLTAVAFCLTAAVAAPIFAQSAPTQAQPQGRHHGEGRLKKLADYLGLTDAQKAQIKPILENARQQAKIIRQNMTLSPEDKKTQEKELRKSTMEQIKAILTPDQLAKLKAMHQHKHGGDSDKS